MSTAPIWNGAICSSKCWAAASPGSTPAPTRSLVEASHFVQILEQRQGMRIACPEEIALRMGYITLDHFEKLAQRCAKSSYGQYLLSIHETFVKSRRAEL